VLSEAKLEPAAYLSEPIKVFALLKRRADLDMAAFSRHWRTRHAEAALKLTMFFERYVQNHLAEEPLPGFGRAYDGAAELWYANWARCTALAESEEYRSDAYLDNFAFLDVDAGGMLVTRPIASPVPRIPRASACATKAIVFWRRRAGLPAAEFTAMFQERVSPLLAPEGRCAGAERCIAVPAPGEHAPAFDAVEQVWWATEGDFAEDMEALARTGPDHALVDRGSSTAARVAELYVHWQDGRR